MTDTVPHAEMIETLWAKSLIERRMTDLGRALDFRNWSLYRSCFTDTVCINFQRTLGFPEIRVDADTWTRLAELLLANVRTHHQFSNYATDLNGDQAEAIIYLVARHWRSTDDGSSEYTQNGWYENRFTRIGGDWKINRLLHTHRWTSGNGGLFGMPSGEAGALLGQVFCEANRIQ